MDFDFDDLADLCGLTDEAPKVHNDQQQELDDLISATRQLDKTPEEWEQAWCKLAAFDQDAADDCVNGLCFSYINDSVTSLRVILETIVRSPRFTFLHRCRAAEALGNLFYTYEVLQAYMYDTKDDVNFTFFIDSLLHMITFVDFTDEMIEELLHWIFTTSTIMWSMKFKLFKQVSEYRVKSTGLLVRLGKTLINNNSLSNYTVLVLQLTSFDDKTLRNIFTRTKNSRIVNVKSDIYDHLLTYPKMKDEALDELKKLGEGMRTLDSSQNVHMVTANVEQWLREIAVAMEHTTIDSKVIEATFQLLREYWKETLPEDKQAKLVYALQRLELDQSVYGSIGYKLSNILARVWKMIENSPYKEELEKRLCEELVEMSETCSTGHLLRLMNVFSGYGSTSLTVDPAVEMRSVINKRVEMYFESMAKYGEEGEKARDEIMEAWADGNEALLQERLYPQLSRIHDEMYADYVGQGLMEPLDFTTHYRDIINKLFIVA
jgi:hypothetical protein